MKPGGIFLLNTLWSDEQLETHLPLKLKRYLAENNIRFYTINAMRLAQEVGLGRRINTAMETAFFKLADIIPFDEVLPLLKEEALKSYGHKSMAIVEKTYKQSIGRPNCFIKSRSQTIGERWRCLKKSIKGTLVIYKKYLNQ